jgi:hypothetical protein
VKIGLEIRVPEDDTFQVDTLFNIPTSALDGLELGRVVGVWVDPREPDNPDKNAKDIQQGYSKAVSLLFEK